MRAYAIKRMAEGFLTALVVVTLMFIVLRVIPGDPAEVYLADFYTPELAEQVREQLGLNKPLAVQYVDYVKGIATGDWGRSYRSRRPVLDTLLEQYPYTIQLTGLTLLIAIPFGMLFGVLAGTRRNSPLDVSLMSVAVAFISAPGFLVGLIMLWVFAASLGWFPFAGAGDRSSWGSLLYYLILPAAAQGLRSAAVIARMTRSSLVDVLQEDYIRTAKAKGLQERAVVFGHGLRNALISVISVIGVECSILIGGAVITESVFSRPGIGRLLVESILCRDYPMVQGTVLMLAFMVVVVNIVTDLAYGLADPRVRF